MNKQVLQQLRPLIYVFVLVSALALTGKKWMGEQSVDSYVVLGGNLALFAVSLTAFFITVRALQSANPQAFVRAMYGSFMVKFFVVVIAAFAYIMTAKQQVNKPGLGVCAGLYILYTVFETRGLTRLLRKKKDG